MPQIHLKQPGQPVADFSVSDCIVTVAGVVIDCAERQRDTAVIIEIRANKTGAGEAGDGAYLAQIDIPARRYREIQSAGDTGNPPTVARTADPLDSNAVSITLWPTT